MNILGEINTSLTTVGLPIATGVYLGAKENYIVLTPLTERNDDIADDEPLTETTSADVNLYFVGNYQAKKNQMVSLLREAGFFIVDRRYIGFEPDTKQHHYVITVEAKEVL